MAAMSMVLPMGIPVLNGLQASQTDLCSSGTVSGYSGALNSLAVSKTTLWPCDESAITLVIGGA